MDKRLVKITKIYPGSHSVDCIDLETGDPVARAVVVTSAITSNTGLAELASPASREILGLLEVVSGLPLITGFLPPRVSQVLFDEAERRIDRHPSDVYSTIDAGGEMEIYHPSGTFFRIGVSTAHDDLTGQNHDANWAIANNTDKQVSVHLEVANAASGSVATLTIDPSGNITIDSRGAFTATADNGFTFNGDSVFNGNVTINGTENVTDVCTVGNLISLGTAGTGMVIVTGGLAIDGIQFGTHVHGGVTSGTSVTGAPQ